MRRLAKLHEFGGPGFTAAVSSVDFFAAIRQGDYEGATIQGAGVVGAVYGSHVGAFGGLVVGGAIAGVAGAAAIPIAVVGGGQPRLVGPV